MLNRRPSSPALCWMMAFFTASYQHLLRTSSGPQAPSAGCGFPYHFLSINSFSNCNLELVLTSVLTELYNSSTTTQSLTRSLKSHVWSSSSGNNCHAVHRSLSSGAWVVPWGIFFYLRPISSANFRPRDFTLITAIRMCHFLPVHHSEWHFWPGRRSKYHIPYLFGGTKTRPWSPNIPVW